MQMSIRSKRHSTWLKPVLGAAVLIASAQAVHAATVPVTFAQAVESSANVDANAFSYIDNGAGSAVLGTSGGGPIGSPIPVNFTFESGAGILPADLTGIQNATVTMTSSTAAPAQTAFGGTLAEQPITGLVNTIKFTRTTPALPGEGSGTETNLLTITFTGMLSGAVGGTTPSLEADTSVGNTVVYSSDFISFAQATQQDFGIAFSSWDPLVTPPTGLGVNADGNFNSATAAAAATFDFQSNSSGIPEPGAMPVVMFGGLLMLVASGRQMRRQLVSLI
jgi:hypothetical protein